MMTRYSTILSGFLAVGLYLGIVTLFLLYFNHRNEVDVKRFVQKDEHRIQVGISAPKQIVKEPSPVKKVPKKETTPQKKREKVKEQPPKPKPPKPEEKVVEKKVIKEKIVKNKPKPKAPKRVIKKQRKKARKKKKQPKKIEKKTSDLFANIKTPQKPVSRVKEKMHQKAQHQTSPKKSATDMVSNSLKAQKNSDSGVENAYLAKVQRLLEDWPAQSEYVGERVKVFLMIKPNGTFTFKVQRRSNNASFNEGLVEYLKQLQKIGFGYHKGGRTYHFEVEFIAKE